MAIRLKADADSSRRRRRLSQADVPSHTLNEAIRVAQALRDEYALQPASPIQIAQALGIKPTSGGFRSITGAAVAYGLTTGAYNSGSIALTDLGVRAIAPTEEGDDLAALQEAFLRPRVLREFVTKYRGNKFPRPDIANNVLISMGVPPEAASRVQELLRAEARELGLVTEIKGDLFFNSEPATGVHLKADFNAPPTGRDAEDELDVDEPENSDEAVFGEPRDGRRSPDSGSALSERPNSIFLGHGKNRKPLEQLIRVLDEWGIPHKEAIYEANAGRPIPHKVAETMRECGAAVLIFTADEEFRDVDGKPQWRPSENVIHELGAAGVLYDNRIIVFKEEGLTLASNFSSIGYISFEKDKLEAKVFDLLRELRAFDIISIRVGAA
ncbi:TIR domain-containing protein [Conexibacter stalactiti]|uniref:Nucleotide-binding protein n=1 Tax=Conexibacter stalactiti TaxID=1940611 RepID=A0ABU4HKR8_9ACTN|nr:TIR domain-containing protein [Conexibacter stalactiti]MDW5593916.1 nucleotide-binding protein [Conexibacter stalactiti]MEC5034558.1 TIR domain-containing protein [Conexibacter stalactiti]